MSRLFPRIATDGDVAKILNGFADSIERRYVPKIGNRTPQEVAADIVLALRETAKEIVR